VRDVQLNKQNREGSNAIIKKGFVWQAKYQMCSTDLNILQQRLREFAEARDWDQFHSPKNLSINYA
jgi:hypothetical protein